MGNCFTDSLPLCPTSSPVGIFSLIAFKLSSITITAHSQQRKTSLATPFASFLPFSSCLLSAAATFLRPPFLFSVASDAIIDCVIQCLHHLRQLSEPQMTCVVGRESLIQCKLYYSPQEPTDVKLCLSIHTTPPVFSRFCFVQGAAVPAPTVRLFRNNLRVVAYGKMQLLLLSANGWQ